MRDLCCARCARVIIADFWTMVRDETVPTFTHIRLTCSCGNRIKVDLAEPPEHRIFPLPKREIGVSAHT
jgi:hypothetical protein